MVNQHYAGVQMENGHIIMIIKEHAKLIHVHLIHALMEFNVINQQMVKLHFASVQMENGHIIMIIKEDAKLILVHLIHALMELNAINQQMVKQYASVQMENGYIIMIIRKKCQKVCQDVCTERNTARCPLSGVNGNGDEWQNLCDRVPENGYCNGHLMETLKKYCPETCGKCGKDLSVFEPDGCMDYCSDYSPRPFKCKMTPKNLCDVIQTYGGCKSSFSQYCKKTCGIAPCPAVR